MCYTKSIIADILRIMNEVAERPYFNKKFSVPLSKKNSLAPLAQTQFLENVLWKLILFKIIKKYNFKNKKNYLKLIPEIISQINSLKIL